MTTTVHDPQLATLIDEIAGLVDTHGSEQVLTELVAERLRAALATGIDLPEPLTRPDPECYVMYPLHVDPAGRFSIASAVWNVGQGTPVHGHETWGVVGIHSGAEREFRYVKPTAADAGTPLTPAGDQLFEHGQVTVCCTTDDDVHAVAAVGDVPTVGIHVYGADIGAIQRRRYDPATGAVELFVSGWDTPRER